MLRTVRPLVAALILTAAGVGLAFAPYRVPAPAVKECACPDCGCSNCVKSGKVCACPNCPAACAVFAPSAAPKPGCGAKPCCLGE